MGIGTCVLKVTKGSGLRATWVWVSVEYRLHVSPRCVHVAVWTRSPVGPLLHRHGWALELVARSQVDGTAKMSFPATPGARP